MVYLFRINFKGKLTLKLKRYKFPTQKIGREHQHRNKSGIETDTQIEDPEVSKTGHVTL